MSTSAALVVYAPIEARLLPRADRRYRAGVAMEALEVRRVLSAAVDGAGAMDELTPDDGTVVICAGPSEDVGGDPADYEPWDPSADPAEFELMFTTMVGDDGASGEAADDSGVDWPEGWGWSLDRLPTPEEVDAANNGDDLAGLWVPIRTLGGGDEDPVYGDDGAWDDGQVWAMDGEAVGGGDVDPNLNDGDFDPRVIFYSVGGVAPTQRGPEAEAEAAPAAAEGTGGDAVGGAPAPSSFIAGATPDGLLLGKLKLSVTGEDQSDLPFMN